MTSIDITLTDKFYDKPKVEYNSPMKDMIFLKAQSLGVVLNLWKGMDSDEWLIDAEQLEIKHND